MVIKRRRQQDRNVRLRMIERMEITFCFEYSNTSLASRHEGSCEGQHVNEFPRERITNCLCEMYRQIYRSCRRTSCESRVGFSSKGRVLDCSSDSNAEVIDDDVLGLFGIDVENVSDNVKGCYGEKLL